MKDTVSVVRGDYRLNTVGISQGNGEASPAMFYILQLDAEPESERKGWPEALTLMEKVIDQLPPPRGAHYVVTATRVSEEGR